MDYLTLWNRDDGLVSGGLCIANPFINPIELTSHNLDNERSALLVAAPAIGSSYNLNSQDYKLYRFYTAAHEDTFFDQSYYVILQNPVSIGNHLELWLSRSKHATYFFNPEDIRLTPLYVIFAIYTNLVFLYETGAIDLVTYLALLFAVDQTFTRCIVEDFNEQGGMYANTRINIGELSQPLNGSNFIQDTELSYKLSLLLY